MNGLMQKLAISLPTIVVMLVGVATFIIVELRNHDAVVRQQARIEYYMEQVHNDLANINKLLDNHETRLQSLERNDVMQQVEMDYMQRELP